MKGFFGRLPREGENDEVVKHALAVRTAVAIGNYTTFFRLYRTAPNLSPCLMGMPSFILSSKIMNYAAQDLLL